jgi:hypothetical protein
MPPTTGGTKDEKAPTGLDQVPEKVLIRFIDTGLEPGRSYQYYVQVRLKNPNFGKDKVKDVAFPAMAEKTHLESPFVLTPPVYMPTDYAFYFVDQWPLSTEKKNLRGVNPKSTIETRRTVEIPGYPNQLIPVQIHQLVQNSSADEGRTVGDWVVAERLFLGRGEMITRRNLEVEVPVWERMANAFRLGEFIPTTKGKTARWRKAIPVDFGDEASPVLADFRGGKLDEGNVEILVFNGDGRLMVRNSYEDADPESAIGAERAQRYEAWRTRLESVRNAANPPAGAIPPKGGRPID